MAHPRDYTSEMKGIKLCLVHFLFKDFGSSQSWDQHFFQKHRTDTGTQTEFCK